jgi:hypothetical protein
MLLPLTFHEHLDEQNASTIQFLNMLAWAAALGNEWGTTLAGSKCLIELQCQQNCTPMSLQVILLCH